MNATARVVVAVILSIVLIAIGELHNGMVENLRSLRNSDGDILLWGYGDRVLKRLSDEHVSLEPLRGWRSAMLRKGESDAAWATRVLQLLWCVLPGGDRRP